MKKFLATLLTIFAAITIPLTAYAAETGGFDGFDESNFWCNVTFCITDESGTYPGDRITAIMTDTTKTVVDSYTFTTANSWGSGKTPIYSMTAPTTYTVTFEGVEEGYAIINTLDRSSEITFDAEARGTADCLWSIVLIGGEEAAATDEANEAEGNVLQQSESGNHEVSNEEAEKVYQAFLDTVSYIQDEQDWQNNLLHGYDLFGESLYGEWYAEYVEGGTVEDFLAMSLFDRFVWSETYLRFAQAVSTGNMSANFGSPENFQRSITRPVTLMMENVKGHEAVKEAYLTLAQWQYDYVQENGYPYNFISGRTYLEETGTHEAPADTETKSDDELLAEAASELMAEVDETTREQVEEEKGIWDDTLEILSRNMITIVFIVILLIVLAVVVWKRRTMNIDDTKGGDSSIDSTNDK